MPEPLTAAERRRLRRLEEVVDHGRDAYVAAAEALAAIRDERLHRPQTFAAYVRRRWSNSRQWAYDLLTWRDVCMSTGVDNLSQRAARVLAVLPVEERRRVVSEARRLRPAGELTARILREALGRTRRVSAEAPADGAELIHGDFRPSPPEPGSIDLVMTDPPWKKAWLPYWSDLGAWAATALKPGGLLVSYSPTAYLPDVLAALGQSLTYLWTLARVSREDNGPGHYTGRLHGAALWTPLVVFGKSPASPIQMSDLLRSTGAEKDAHEWQQPVDEATRVIERLTQPGDIVADPCAGSGTTGVASAKVGRRWLGWEIERETFRIARRRLGLSRREPKSAA